jgi:hypothetical protein
MALAHPRNGRIMRALMRSAVRHDENKFQRAFHDAETRIFTDGHIQSAHPLKTNNDLPPYHRHGI